MDKEWTTGRPHRTDFNPNDVPMRGSLDGASSEAVRGALSGGTPDDEAEDVPMAGSLDGASAEPAKPKTPPKPGTYTAEGDPYTYRVEPDGGVTIMEGPTGVGQKLTTGAAYEAILGQIRAGQLKSSGAGGAPGLAADRPGMNSHLDASLDELGGDLGEATASVVKRNMEKNG